jgi:endonuclease/exonuclease/phosphatase family metal-dependent hydrolase
VIDFVALVGHFVRGRAIWLEMSLYLPLVPLGVVVVVLGSILGSFGKRSEAVAILLLGLVSIFVGGQWMIGRGPGLQSVVVDPANTVRVIHWNVLWGGFAPIREGWASMVDEIASRSPDLVILSEAASFPQRRQLIARLGTGWNEISAESPPWQSAYRNRIAILSRWPMRSVGAPRIRNGSTYEVIVEHPKRPIHLLAIDGKSQPTIPRSPMLEDIALICGRAEHSALGPIDIIAGDFNCVGRTRGFDDIREASGGFAPASESSTGWRATWPSWLPIYDIDHVWVRHANRITSCVLFSRIATDHRGQMVVIDLDHWSSGAPGLTPGAYPEKTSLDVQASPHRRFR